MNIRNSILYILALLASSVFGLEATLDVVPPKITLDESAVVSIAVKDANATRPELPRIEGFLISDAGKIWKTDATNRWTVFKYRFHPANPGTFRIGPFDYIHQGESVSLTGELVVTPDTKPPTAPKQLFNPAAREYIYGNTEVASNKVEAALKKFPDDETLLKLKKLIDEQQKQNQQKQNQKDQQQKQDQQKKDDQKNQQDQQNQNQDQQKKDQQQDQSSQDKQKQDQQKQQQQQADQSKDSGQDKEQPQPSQPQQAGEMSQQEAQQLLDAMKQDEQDRRVNLKPFLGGPVRVEKDW